MSFPELPPQIPLADRADFTAELSHNSFRYFCQLIMHQKLGAMHEDWMQLINNSGGKHISIMSARGHFKTSIMSKCYPIWRMYRGDIGRDGKKFRVVAQSGTLKQSSEIMTLVKDAIENNDILAEKLLPNNLHTSKWSETEIKAKNGCRMMCVPFGDAVRGFHPHLAVLDDILKVGEQTDIEGAKDKFWGTVFPIINANKGKLVVVGTPVSYTDLLHDLQRKKDAFQSKTYPAVVLGDSGEWLRAQFPEHYSIEDLRAIKDVMPADKWAREYMCQPLSSETSMFPEVVVRKAVALHGALRLLYNPEPKKDEAGKDIIRVPHRVMGCDIAISDNKDSDWNVFTVLESLPQHPYYVRDIFRRHMVMPDAILEIERLQAVYRCSKILVEKTGVGAGVSQMLTRASAIRGVIVEFDTKVKSREQILGNLEVILRNGGLAIPDNEILRAELAQFSYKKTKTGDGKMTYESLGKHDDTVLSLAIAVEAASIAKPASIRSI